jgi:predicted SAM-dependent methyltransferase
MLMIDRLRQRQEHIRARSFLRKEVNGLRARGEMVKVVVGAGATHQEGWLTTNLPTLDALKRADWRRIFPRSSIHRILAEHVIEHWTQDQFSLFLRIVQPFLSDQGVVRIAVPDGFHPDPSYIEHVKPGGIGPGADDHKVLYDHVTMRHMLSRGQYDYELIEYFDEAGQFHRCSWDTSDGFIRRSAEYDGRNRQRALSYTSLIVDAWPMVGSRGPYLPATYSKNCIVCEENTVVKLRTFCEVEEAWKITLDNTRCAS